MYQNFFKEGNEDHKFLWFPDLQDKIVEFLRSEIAFDKIYLECAENVKAEPTRNNSGFITY